MVKGMGQSEMDTHAQTHAWPTWLDGTKSPPHVQLVREAPWSPPAVAQRSAVYTWSLESDWQHGGPDTLQVPTLHLHSATLPRAALLPHEESSHQGQDHDVLSANDWFNPGKLLVIEKIRGYVKLT